MAAIKIDQQNQLFGLISRTFENFKKLGSEKMTRGAAQTRIQQVDRHWEKFESNHWELCQYKDDKDFCENDYFRSDLFSLCEESYISIKSSLADFVNTCDGSTLSHATSAENLEEAGSRRRDSHVFRSLPKISLLKFSGKYSEWTPFRDLFESIVGSNESLSLVEKLHYLKTNVLGDAAKLIASIPITNDNYDRAWNKLKARYDNKRSLVNAQLDILFSLKPIQKRCAKELECLRSTVSEVLEALEALGGPIDQWDFFLVYFVCRRLDSDTHEAWEIHLSGTKDPPHYSDLDSFLEGRIRALETVDARSPSSKPRVSSGAPFRISSSSAQSHVSTSATAATCSYCGFGHYISACPQYQQKSPKERKDIIISKKLCFNCLGKHLLQSCFSSKRCMTCKRRHHTSLHSSHQTDRSAGTSSNFTTSANSSSVDAGSGNNPQAAAANTSGGQNQAPAANDRAGTYHSRSVSAGAGSSQVLLATASIYVVCPQGRERKARALLDQGSELSFICESLVQTLQLARRHSSIALFGIGASKQTTTRGAVILKFRSLIDPSAEYSVEAHVLPRLTGRIPSSPVQVEEWDHLSGLKFADPSFNTPGTVDIILGASIYGHLLYEDVRRGKISHPVAQLTSLGWVVSGPVGDLSLGSSSGSSQGYFCHVNCDLHDLVQSFWEHESIPSARRTLSEEDERCEQHFIETHSRDSSGRYTVRLPFKSKIDNFGKSEPIASRMLKTMHRRFQRDSKFYKLYSDFLDEYEALGHMQLAGENEEKSYYLPHHGVLRESSTTTKLRVVFNGSQKTDIGISLNDTLHSGPKIQLDLIDVILRWRLYQYVFSCDVEKMYRQIQLHPEDRKYQCILWSKDPEQDPLTYKLSTVTYGLTSAPFLAIRVLRQLADDEADRFPLAADMIRQNIYVDDLLSGAYSLPQAQEGASQIDGLLMAGGFCLQKWVSNYPAVLNSIPKNRQTNLEKSIEADAILRALGLSWCPTSDKFIFTFQEQVIRSSVITKRSVLSVIARLFDPLGWLAPVIIVAKIFLQDLWKYDLKWDDALPEDLKKRWEQFVEELGKTTSISIPRWLGTCGNSLIELHGFSDASRSALAAVVYLRVIDDDFYARTSLLIAKTKVAPLKPTSIPRLELSAAVMLAQLIARIKTCLNLQNTPCHLWTDSSVALVWIRGHPSKWKDFIANRVLLIQELVPQAQWRHVAGSDNPADVGSRGLSPASLQKHNAWWKGPEWLVKPSPAWPTTTPSLPEEVNLEEKGRIVHVATTTSDIWELVDRYSSIERLLRVTARIMIARDLFRKRLFVRESSLAITSDQIEEALCFWIKQTQRAHFAAEIGCLRRGDTLSKSSHLLRLTPFLDKVGLLRVGGRLHNATLDYSFKHPLILPRHSALTSLLIESVHRKTLHGGVQLTLSTLRREYWIIGGRTSVRSFILRCIPCARQRGATAKQMMGQLPSLRTAPARPFLHSGVDYAGPFTLKTWKGRSAKTYKGYLIIFVCFATSAVHLEVSTDYSTEGFLAAYRRFTARRGICKTLRSDCGTNFVGADAELKRMFDSASKEFQGLRTRLAMDLTEWKFNPPSAPHFGGKWEAGVKSVKFHLRRVIGEALLTYEEFSTLLVQVEGVLNSRPLCPISDDPDDAEALTPGHFLTGAPLNSIPDHSLSNASMSYLSRWQRCQQMLEHFWKRWSREYLQRMQAISKWHHPNNELKVGSLILVVDERYPPSRWPLARITALHSGNDGLVRVAAVRTASGSEFRRPIVKLCVLPIDCNEK